MANTTFKGPVRSQNGFQEWDGTSWVPVGGGASAIIVPYGATTNVELTEVGQQFTLAGDFDVPSPPGSTVVTFSCPLAPANVVRLSGVYMNGAPPTNVNFFTLTGSMTIPSNYPFLLQGVLVAIGDYGSGPQAQVFITGFAIGSAIT